MRYGIRDIPALRLLSEVSLPAAGRLDTPVPFYNVTGTRTPMVDVPALKLINTGSFFIPRLKPWVIIILTILSTCRSHSYSSKAGSLPPKREGGQNKSMIVSNAALADGCQCRINSSPFTGGSSIHDHFFFPPSLRSEGVRHWRHSCIKAIRLGGALNPRTKVRGYL